jgi:hypothetical protein
MRRFCYDGIFMELPDTALARETVRTDPWGMCAGFSGEAAISCARMLPAAPPRSTGGVSEFSGAIAGGYLALCEAGPTGEMRESCLNIVENYLVALVPSSEFVKICAQLKGDDAGRCVSRIAAEYSFQQRSDAAYVADAICASLADAHEYSSCVDDAARAGTLGKAMKHLNNLSIFDPRPYE